MDDQRQAYEQTYTELLAVVARLDALRRRGGREVEPMANAAMYAASHAACTLWRALHPRPSPPVFAYKGDEFLELAREWASVQALEIPLTRQEPPPP
ncbi:hypothetical protein ACIP4U_35995 [Streptomyces caelestis]|uniref:hypothetical protein n=1 Tax=Streptomyces caelestis TaxID=36816 RepID=UPI0038213FEF